MVDKPEFLAKCTALWTDGASAVTQSFVALYYSLMSLGALVGIREDEPVDGIENLEWSRIFFEEARSRTSVSMVTDIEMVQCYFFLAKICQNELNNHSAYMYGGLAVRTALAMGINREPQPNQKLDTALTKAASRTWWSLYSLETEMSFAMGRPDSLGADVYHNRRYPAIRDDPAYSGSPPELLEPPHCAMIKAMVDFARITKSVILGIYLAESTLQQALALARQIEQDLERWLEGLPAQIRPSTSEDEPRPLKRIKDPQYAKKQRLVLKIRYHNVRILLFGYFLTKLSTLDRATAAGFQEELTKCLDSAKQTIETIYEACQRHDFFRTWFYNTMYILFATSIVLIYIPRESGKHELEYLYKLVEMAIEILEIMDESVVAMEAAKMIQGALTRTRCMIPLAPRDTAPGDTAPADTAAMEFQKTASWNTYAGLFDLTEGDLSGDLPFPLGDPSAMYPLGE
ncbi:unnamed protein product [Clonostachys rhizophaga]|uniref:Xylanolytic transcriptional activator regulatory domain-containing protein n=1 Tax=Clonostachys rhizophaga TaxID=160324 RepID=A0A9N9YTI4_9HYPO|nr:unnamed protein product [Clonostachys rhizophaga]